MSDSEIYHSSNEVLDEDEEEDEVPICYYDDMDEVETGVEDEEEEDDEEEDMDEVETGVEDEEEEDDEEEESDNHDTEQTEETSSNSKKYGSITVHVVKEKISNVKVDVLVNSTATSLKLRNGSASRELLAMAGNSIQQECDRKYPNGIKFGEIAKTKGGNSRAKQIYHVAIKKASESQSNSELKDLVKKCLQEASKDNSTSIAFPALGTGFHGFKKDDVASLMFKCVEEFEQQNKNSSLTEVKFAIYHGDSEAYSAFVSKCSDQQTDTSSRTVFDGHIGSIIFTLKVGKLQDQGCDVIMTSGIRRLDLNQGTLIKAIAEAAGTTLQAECHSKYPSGIQHGEVAVLSAGNLNCKKVYIGALPRFDKPAADSDSPIEVLKKLVTNCLKQAAMDKMVSICFPTLGTGFLKFPPDASANCMLAAISDFSKNNASSSVKEVVIAVHNEQSVLQKVLKPYEEASKKYKTKPVVAPKPKYQPLTVELPESRPKSSSGAKRISQMINFDLKSNPLFNIARRKSKQNRPTSSDSSSSSESLPEPVVSLPIPAPRRSVKPTLRSVPPPIPSRNTPEFCLHMYRKDIYPPENWTKFNKSKKVTDWIVEVTQSGKYHWLLDVDTAMFNSIEKLVQKSWEQAKIGHGRDANGLDKLGYTRLKVTKVQRVENLKVYESYYKKKQELFHKAAEDGIFKKLSQLPDLKHGGPKTEAFLDDCLKETLDEEVNEGFFFHGTKSDKIDNLVRDGMDPRLSQGGAVFGPAIYMAESSTKADQYTDERLGPRRKDNLQMVLLRACLGNICLMKKSKKFKRAPCSVQDCMKDDCSHNSRFNSIVAEEKYIFREFVVYDSPLVYPEYVISYERV